MTWLRRLWKSNYVRILEEDNARLRTENRAFLNSLLATVGFPPVETPEDPKPLEYSRLRKRSWPQIQRIREEQSRK
jgi:hypothetical protein